MSEQPQAFIEELLQELPLQEPSSELDASVMRLLTPQLEPSPASTSKSRKTRFALTAASFALLGFGLGWWFSPASETRIAAGNKTKSPNEAEAVVVTEPPTKSDAPTQSQPVERPRLIDQGFVLHKGEQPARRYRIEGGRKNDQRASLKLRKEILLPSEEI